MTTGPNQELLADESVPRVKLAGLQWPVPRLALKQNKAIYPMLGVVLARMKAGDVSAEAIEDMAKVVYLGLTRGHADLTREDFEDLPINVVELSNALPVVIGQTGLTKAAEKTEDAPPGEARASQTGTRSRPKSALAPAGRGSTSGR